MSRRLLDPRLSVAVVYVAAQFMSIMDTTIVNVALPTLARDFDVAAASIDAVVVAYLISLAVFIPVSGWLGDRWGTKRVFLIALAIFSVASALCGLATSFTQLVLFRALQGAGGGLLTPVGMAMLFRTFPPAQRMQAARLLILPTIVAPALGPVLGGLLVDRLSWRWIFFVNVPIGLAALLFGLLFLREHRETDPGAFDLPGFLLASSGFPLVMYALTEGSVHGWESPRICGTAVAGTLLLLAFVIVELRTPQPLVQLRLFGNRLFRTTTSVSVLASAGFLGILFLVPLFLQQARGASALSSGLTTFPEALGVLFSTQIVARLYPRVGPRRLMAGGMVGAAVCMSMLGFVGLTTNAWLVRVLMFLTGGCMAYVFLPTQAAAFTTVAPSATGRASTLFSAQRQLGAACGVALISSVLAVVGTTAVDAAGAVQPHLAAYRAGFFAAAAFALAAALLALAVPDAEAAASMRQPAPHDKSVREEALVAD